MKRIGQRLLPLLLLALLAGPGTSAAKADQILASVGPLQVTAADLNSAMASAPFADKFPSMAEDDQAGLRGDMLRRLVTARLLTLEAQRLGIDKSAAFRKDIDDFRLGLLYRAYIDKLRQGIVIPDDTLAAMKKQFKDDRDGMEAARAAYVGERYQAAKGAAMQALLKADNVRMHAERIAGAVPNTVLAEGGVLRVRYGDLLEADELAKPPAQAEIAERLQRRVELVAAAKAAADQGADVGAAIKSYERQRLPAALMEVKTKEWIPDEKTLRDWYDQHPQAATVPVRRHVGQLVAATRQEADGLRERIAKGESLFMLAGKYSVDPLSRKQNGDIGWVAEGRAAPELDLALAKLKDGEVSPVLETKDGKFHILTVLEHVGGRKEAYGAVRERIAQAIVNERLPVYVAELEHRYPVTWAVVAKPGTPAATK